MNENVMLCGIGKKDGVRVRSQKVVFQKAGLHELTLPDSAVKTTEKHKQDLSLPRKI